MSNFDTVVGLEVHVQLKTDSKIFCPCSTRFESPPNTNICPVCCGYPGVLPVFNKKALSLAVRVSLALNCKINKSIYFERKNYFYPDLPKNYQISQYKQPLGQDGYIKLPSGKRVGIERVHMEEDAGKLLHKGDYSLVDFNRTGVPLLEIVSCPGLESPQQAYEYLTYLKLILQYIGASDCDMEKGSLRCDANISLKPAGSGGLGTKVELKNMNSFKGVRSALEFETRRQRNCIEKGEKIRQETRLWDTDGLKTSIMRTKEEAHDYRYFPEPDLLDFKVSDDIIENEREALTELPQEKRNRFIEEYGFSQKEADVFIANPWLADFFEQTLHFYDKRKDLANWLLGPFLEQVNNLEGKFDPVKISPENFSKIVRYFAEKKINNIGAKKILALSIVTDEDVDKIIEREKLAQISGTEELDKFIEEVVNENPKPVKQYREGKQQAIMFLVGQVMRKTRGKANPGLAREILERRLK